MARTKIAQQRAADWNARGIPRALWPDVGRGPIEQAHRTIWQAAVERLAGGIPTLDIDRADQRPFSIAAMLSGMGPLLGYWRELGEVVCDPLTSELLDAHLDHGRRRAFNMETGLTNILAACQARSVRPTVMKGMFTARRYFPEPGTRPQADIDLLVRPEDLAVTREALKAIDFRQLQAPAFGAETWEPPGVNRGVQSVEIDHAENPWTVDLHTSIDRPYFRGRWSTFGSAAFALTEPWMVRQRPALVFKHPLLLAHLAHHAARDINRIRLVRLVELVLVIRRDRLLDWDACLKLLEESDVKGLVYPVFAIAERIAPGTVPASFFESLDAATTKRLRRATEKLYDNPLVAYFKRSPSERLMWADGPVEMFLCWSDTVWPAGHSGADRWRIVKRRFQMFIGRTSTRQELPGGALPRIARRRSDHREP